MVDDEDEYDDIEIVDEDDNEVEFVGRDDRRDAIDDGRDEQRGVGDIDEGDGLAA
jgi:hypothetical protein